MRKLIVLGLATALLCLGQTQTQAHGQHARHGHHAGHHATHGTTAHHKRHLRHGLKFHAPFDFYPRYVYAGHYYPDTVSVYEPTRRYHPAYGYRYWIRY